MMISFYDNIKIHLRVHACCLNLILDLNVFSQALQGSETPSKWFASMWSLMATFWPSFPHILQILVLAVGFELMFWPCSIIDLTFSSSYCKKSWDSKFGIAILCSILVFIFGGCSSKLGSWFHCFRSVFRFDFSLL